MANISQYVQRTMPQAGGTIPRAVVPQGVGAMAGLVGDALSGFGESINKRQEEQGRAWAAAAIAQKRLEWSSQLADRQAGADIGAPDFTGTLIKDFDIDIEEFSKTAPSDAARSYFRERMMDVRTMVGEKAITFEAAARLDYRDTQFDLAKDTAQKIVMSDPDQFEVVMAEQLAIVRTSEMPPKQRADREQKLISGMAEASVSGQLHRNPTSFLQSVGLYGGTRQVDMKGMTGNKAFDMLPFDKRMGAVTKAITLKSQMDNDSEREAKEIRKAAGEEAFKEALSRLAPVGGGPRLTRAYIEEIRPTIEATQYKTLLSALDDGGLGSGGSRKTDPSVFRDLQVQLRDDPEGARRDAVRHHANGLLSNSDFSSIMSRSDSLDRQGGPKTPYERVRNLITGRLDPGPMVQDPVGRGRLAEALHEFDSWVEGGKRSDTEIEERGRRIISQYSLVDFTGDAVGLPQPRSGNISRNIGADPLAAERQASAAFLKAKADFAAKKMTKQEYMDEASRINRWLKLINQEKAAQQRAAANKGKN